ncbi:hypothetical protein ACFYRD_20560 [Streptomyces hirsutus]|uniref:hypothetical protein n=1 Tax=Streptomyces hirsutus TaxID=35620 RepID=UPI0036CBD287
MSWVLHLLAQPQINPWEDEEISPKAALSILTSGDHRHLERLSRRNKNLPPKKNADGQFTHPDWALVYSFSLVTDPNLIEEGLNLLSEVVSSPAVREDSEMMAVALTFVSWGLSQLGMSDRAIAVLQDSMSSLPYSNLATLLLRLQLTVYLADDYRYEEALEQAVGAKSALRRWKEEEAPTDLAGKKKDVAQGVSEAVNSNISLLRVQVGSPKQVKRVVKRSGSYWRSRNKSLEYGFTSSVRDAFNLEVGEQFGRTTSRVSGPESQDSALTSYLLESQVSGYYRRVLAARSLVGQHGTQDFRNLNQKEISYHVILLQKSRDSKAFEKSLQVLFASGPLQPLVDVVEGAAQRITWPPRKPDLIALKVGGRLLKEDLAKRALESLITMPSGRHLSDLNSSYLADVYIWPAIRAVMKAARDETAVSERMRTAGIGASGLLASELATTARSIEWQLVNEEERERWHGWTAEQNAPDLRVLKDELTQQFAAIGDTRMIDEYVQSAHDLSLPQVAVLVEAGAARHVTLPEEVEETAARIITQELDRLTEDASRGSYSFGMIDSLLLAGIFSRAYPRSSLWSEIQDVLTHRRVSASQKSAIFEWVSHDPSVVPTGFMAGLTIDKRLSLLESGWDSMSPAAHFSALRFLCALELLPAVDFMERVTELTASDRSIDRAQAARTLGVVRSEESQTWRFALLDVLSRDKSAFVRSAAGNALGFTLVSVSADQSVLRGVLRCLQSDGVWIPLRTLYGIRSSLRGNYVQMDAAIVSVIRSMASNHADFSVRLAADDVRQLVQ